MPKLDHIALEVSNLDRSVKFYTEDLGFILKSRATNEEQQEEYCFLTSEGTTLELISDMKKTYGAKQKIDRPYCPHICFATDDMEKTIKELGAKNIEIIRGPLEIAGEETWVYFSDPDGNVLEYIQWFK
ncbi:MAG: VOC family protein [Desulfobacteraceae bacterium]|nr:VOC family protein [Desulfobacteraceae bacterium]